MDCGCDRRRVKWWENEWESFEEGREKMGDKTRVDRAGEEGGTGQRGINRGQVDIWMEGFLLMLAVDM